MVDEIKLRHTPAALKLREGYDRLAREHPDLDFSRDTPEIVAAEIEFSEQMALYAEGKCGFMELWEAFQVWKRVFLNQPKAGMLW